MIQIDFKLIFDTTDSNSTNQINIQSIETQRLYEWLRQPDNYLKGGFCISVLNEPWNGYWDDEAQSHLFFIDHIDGALNFLKAIHFFNLPQTTRGTTQKDIWPCDGSSLEATLFTDQALLLKDEGLGCEEMITALPFFSFLFQEANNEFIKSLEKVITLCTTNDEMKTGLNYLVKEARKYSIKLSAEQHKLFHHLKSIV